MIETLEGQFSGRLITATDDVAPFLTDWRKTWTGTAIGVAQPDSAEDVARVVRWCAAHRVAIVPQGGNTGQSGGSVPEATGTNLVLSLTRMNRVRAIDPANDTIAVDAGCVLQTVQAAADGVERYFPLSLGAEGSCTIGGNLATNAGGTAVLRYGNARDLCLGLEVVTASGEIWGGMKALRKDNSGYDLRDLFIGSEGTLGVITGAVLKLFPKPAGRATAFAGVASVADAMAVFAEVRARAGARLTGFEMLSEACLSLVLDHVPGARRPLTAVAPWYVLIALSDSESEDTARAALEGALAGALAAGLLTDAAIAVSEAQARAFWMVRESVSPAQGAAGPAIKHDIAVPVSAIAAFVEDALAAAEAAFPGLRPVTFGHLGDGNLHFNFSPAPGMDRAAFLALQPALNAVVHAKVRAHHGTISAEHGLGVLRRDEVHARRSPVERALMASIKAAFDPQGIMNPAKLLG